MIIVSFKFVTQLKIRYNKKTIKEIRSTILIHFIKMSIFSDTSLKISYIGFQEMNE